jgi:superfamily II DNA or RNA helicase
MIYSLPTGAGANMGILNIVARETEKGDYRILILSPMRILNEQLFNDFSTIVNKDLSYQSINTYYTNNKRSFILFKTINIIEKQIWDDIDNVIIYNVNLKRNNESIIT